MSIQDEQATNTTITEEPIPPRTITSPPDYEESRGYVPHWEGYQGTHAQTRNKVRVVFGGLAGGIFFFGLAAAILSGHFWPVFLVTLAICSLVSSLSSSRARAIYGVYGGFQGFVFFLGLAVCSIVGFWPWILVVLGIAAILGSLEGLWAIWPVARPSMIVDRYYSAIKNHDCAQAYRFLDASLTSKITQEQFTQMAQEQDAAYGPVSSYVIAPDFVTTPLPGEPLPLVTLASNPAENVTVTVTRAHGPSYTVHLQGRQVRKAWKITAFYRI